MDRTLIERRGTNAVASAGGVVVGGGSVVGVTDGTGSQSPMSVNNKNSTPSFDHSMSESDQVDGVGGSTTDLNNAVDGDDKRSPSSPNSKQNPSIPNSQNHHQQQQQQQHNQKSSFRPLSDFIFEDPAVYTQSEIKDILDMINDGNRGDQDHLYSGGSRDFEDGSSFQQQQQQQSGSSGSGAAGGQHRGGGEGGSNAPAGGGLKAICKAYGVLGFIKFLDCYYLTLITKRAKVGSIGENSIYTIKVRMWTVECLGV